MSTGIAFIGGGNMARAIVAGLVDDGYDAASLRVSEPSADRRGALSSEWPGLRCFDDNRDAAAGAACIVLAVKPGVVPGVCRELADTVRNGEALVLSIAAGVRTTDIVRWLGGRAAVVRAMPNQPALLRRGISGLYANPASGAAGRDRAAAILEAVGRVVVVRDEADLDAVTAVSGSGPAYFFLLLSMLEDAGRTLGLDRDTAHVLAVETAKGAIALASSSDESMEELIARVRSPGGTTAAALDSLEQDGFRDIFIRAVGRARDRAGELADQVSGEADK